jgi:hypothetical protein
LVEDYDDQPAGFGPSFPSTGIKVNDCFIFKSIFKVVFSKGYVVLTNPKNACTKVSPPPTIPISPYRWIALIPRSKPNESCDFDLKVSFVFIFNHYFISSLRFSMLKMQILAQLLSIIMKMY